jgi:hypothetical protein
MNGLDVRPRLSTEVLDEAYMLASSRIRRSGKPRDLWMLHREGQWALSNAPFISKNAM